MKTAAIPAVASNTLTLRNSETCNLADIAGHLRRVCLSVEKQSTRYKLAFVKVEADGEMIRFVSTDGRRLHLLDIPSTINPCEMFLDPKELAKAATAIKAAKHTATLTFEPSGLTMDNGKKIVYIGNDRSEGRFPRYKDVFPTTADWFEVDAGRLVGLTRAFGHDTDESEGCDFIITGSCLAFGTKPTGLAFLPFTARRDDDSINQTVATLATPYIVEALDGLPIGQTVKVNYIDHKSAFHFIASGYQAVIMPLTRDR